MKKGKDVSDVMKKYSEYLSDGRNSAEDWRSKNDHMIEMLKHTKNPTKNPFNGRLAIAAFIVIAILYFFINP